jgi:CubicO group peptidase (beta-lactamase class C family)
VTAIGPAAGARVENAIAAAGLPGLVLAVASRAEPVGLLCVGADADGRPLERQSLFPVASVTKLATALCVLRLHDRGRLDVDDRLARHLPGAAAAAAGPTLADLLCHVGGLPRDVPAELAPDRPGLDWPTLARACLATAPADVPRARVQYSNVGYGLLALAAEAVTGRPFADVLAEEVLRPLDVEGYLGRGQLPREAATLRDVRGPAAGTEIEPFNSAGWRSLALPWAGLITTAEGALRLVRAFAGDFLSRPTGARAIADQTGGLGGGLGGRLLWDRSPWGLGPELRGQKRPHWAPDGASPGSFGHAGWSGCLAWHEPARDLSWALIGTRTADSGWLLRQGSAIGAALLEE